MRQFTIGLILSALTAASAGCHAPHLRSGLKGALPGVLGSHECSSVPAGLGILGRWQGSDVCGSAAGEFAGRGQGLPADVRGGNATATVNYPYYTLRGPRDFLAAHPPSIGP